jgi:signal transduction histidine kinase
MAERITPQTIIQRAFPGIAPGEVEQLVENSVVHIYPPETVLCYEGETESTFFIILDGNVRVTKVINNVETRVLNFLGPGDFFGEMAIIHNAPRTATVKTIMQTTVLEIKHQAFDEILEKSNSFALALTREISRRLRENDQMAVEDLKQRANELAKAYQQLAELEFARRQFLTTIAHELRTPLTVANGFLNIIQNGNLDKEAYSGAIDSVAKNISQIISLVNDILFIQEMDLILPVFHPVDINSLVKKVCTKFSSKITNANVKIVDRLDDAALYISGEENSLERAFGAILDNAIKFSPDGGEIVVSAEIEPQYICIKIQDHGIGISPEVLPKIFDRFFHIDNFDKHLFGGIGLGLSIAHQVIEQHSGKINVTSEVGSGSTFSIYLPVECKKLDNNKMTGSSELNG